MMSPEGLRIATEGKIGIQQFTTEDLQFKILPPLDQPRGFQRFFAMHGRNLRDYGIPAGLALISGLSAMMGMENFNSVTSIEVNPFYIGMAFSTVTYILSRRVFSQI